MALGVRFGGTTTTTVNVVGFSDTSGDISVSLSPGGHSATITTSICGNDRDTVTSPAPDGLQNIGYVGNATIAGLTPFTQYAYTVTKGSDTKTGSFYTMPQRNGGNKYAVAFTTCLTTGSSTDFRSIFKFLNWYRQNNTEYPIVAHIHPDDWGYPDGSQNVSTTDKSFDTNATTFYGSTTLSEYNMSINYTVLMGAWDVTGSAGHALSYSELHDYLNNVSLFVQCGDHEYWNNIWSTGASELLTIPNPLHATAGNYDGVARVAVNNFIKPLMGNIFSSANTESYHWELDLGELQIIAPDCISNITYSGGAVTQQLGTDQITEILTQIDNDKPFKIIANPAFAFRDNSYDGTVMAYKSEQYISSEYNRWVLDDGTAGTPHSIMNNVNTNGVLGTTIFVRGDSHYNAVYKFDAAAAGTNLAESIYEIGLQAANGGRGGSLNSPSYFTEYQPYSGDMEFVGGLGKPGSLHEVCVIAEVDASGGQPVMTVKRYERNWADGNGLPAPNNLPDNTFVIENNIGPDSEYCLTFKKVFSAFQNTNLGVDSENDISVIPSAINSSPVIE